MVRVKVCCIASLDEARLAISLGAAAIGLVSTMPSGPGVIDDATIGSIARAIPPGVATFLLTSAEDPARIIEQQRLAGADTLQICDRLPRGAHAALRAAMPGVRLVQVVHVTGEDSVAEALEVAPEVHAVLLDSGDQRRAVKELGGTGRVHDWAVSRTIRERAAAPVYLAGGLNAANVGEAIRTVQPFGVDLCSGVRTEGRLDRVKLEAFFDSVRNAEA